MEDIYLALKTEGYSKDLTVNHRSDGHLIFENAQRIANQQLPVFNKTEGFSLIVPDYEDLPEGVCKLTPTSSKPIALQRHRKEKNIPSFKEKM